MEIYGNRQNLSFVDALWNDQRFRVDCLTGAVSLFAMELPAALRQCPPSLQVSTLPDYPLAHIRTGEDCVEVELATLGGFRAHVGNKAACSSGNLTEAGGAYVWTRVAREWLPVMAKGMPAANPWRDSDVWLVIAAGSRGQMARLSDRGETSWSVDTHVTNPQAILAVKNGYIVVGETRMVFVSLEGRVGSHLDTGLLPRCKAMVEWGRHRGLVRLEDGRDVLFVSLLPAHAFALPSVLLMPVSVILVSCWVVAECLVHDR